MLPMGDSFKISPRDRLNGQSHTLQKQEKDLFDARGRYNKHDSFCLLLYPTDHIHNKNKERFRYKPVAMDNYCDRIHSSLALRNMAKSAYSYNRLYRRTYTIFCNTSFGCLPWKVWKNKKLGTPLVKTSPRLTWL